MSKRKLVKNYTEALFSTAKIHNLQDEVLEQLHKINLLINKTERLLLILDRPVVAKADKKNLVHEIVKKLSIESIVESFLELLLENARFKLLTDIIDYYSELLNTTKSIKTASVTSSYELDVLSQKQVIDYLETLLQQKLAVKFQYSPQIIGGLVIKYDTYLLDCSIAGALGKISQFITGATS